MVLRGPDGEPATLPLTRTDVDAEVSGQVTSVSVTQRFHNGSTVPIEATYVFPLPDDAAVDAMEMHIGARVLRAQIDRRAQAQARYERARDEGRHAALLEQERPNVFTFRVANIDPGADIEVRTHFFGMARYDDQTYSWAFPMVVGPRYIPGTPLPRAPSGTGAHPDTDRVPDASRISPAYVPPTMRSGHAVTLRVRLDAGAALEHVESLAHEVVSQRTSDAAVDLTLRDKDEIPNRDFVLRWKVAAPALRATVMAHRDAPQGSGYLALSLEPRHDAPPTETTAREIVFLLDTSGSMQGPPLAAVKSAITRALSGMRPDDTFQVIDFADTASAFAPSPLAATPENIARALDYLRGLSASGGTNQLAGIHAALSMPGDPMRLRDVVFMTDGYIGNEAVVLALTHREIGNARIFSFGIGSSVNRYLLDEVALAGRGTAEYLRPDEDPEATIARFYDRIARPYLTDVEVDWGGLPVRDATPNPSPDLSSLSPLTVFARYDRGAHGTVTIRGRLHGRPYAQTVDVTLPEVETAHAAVSSLWARQHIAALSRAEHVTPTPELAEQITGIALAHHLLSAHTSFVAVDEREGASRDRPVRVDQPAEAPEGVNLQSAGATLHGNVGGGSAGESFGSGGLGVSGSGWGGGGTGEGTVGLGSIGTFGHGAGRGTGSGYGAGTGLRSRGPSAPTVHSEAPTAMGALSTDAIRRVVLRNSGQVQHCYEVFLAGHPGVAGRMTLRFVVGLTGQVVTVQIANSTLADAALGQCVQAAIRRWMFPAPATGTVTIQYPFVFSPGR